MRARIRLGLMLLVPMFFCFFVSLSYGDGLDIPDLPLLQAQIHHQRALVNSWETKANIEFFLMMLIVVLGATVTMLQKCDGKKWCSYVVAACGLLISILTYGTKEYFDVDHRTYRKSAEMVKSEIVTAETYLDYAQREDVTTDDKQMALTEVIKSISKIKSIAESIGKPGADLAATGGVHFRFVTTAYAQMVSVPKWAQQARSETSTAVRFVGRGEAASLFVAQSQALAQARSAAAAGMSVSFDTVKQYGMSVNKFVNYDVGRRIYHCYIMVELNKAFLQQ